jgi:two-component system chemotaxis response regulator CheY
VPGFLLPQRQPEASIVMDKAGTTTTDFEEASAKDPTSHFLSHFSGRNIMALNTSLPVLIVDDYQTMLRIIRNLLKQIGFNDVDEAKDGSEALGKLKEKKYGLVISDWNMAPMTGFELLQQVRADAQLNSLPFIMITAEAKTENVVAAKQAGVNNYIVKPFNAETLRSKISTVFGV